MIDKSSIKNGNNKNSIILVAISIICIIAISVSIGVLKGNNNISNDTLKSGEVLGVQDFESGDISGDSNDEEIEEVYLGPEIFSGDARPIAVMIDNQKGAWPQAGLNDAYMVYEVIVEGGETRFMAFYKGQTTEKIGPIRSSRHYFLDYALEHDAIYVHFGWSPLASKDIKSLKINNINGLYDDFYWREPPKNSWQNAFSSMERIMKHATAKKYATTSNKDAIIKYNEKDESIENGMNASKVNVKYSYIQNSSYVYDSGDKIYLRSMRGIEHRDRWTNEQFYAKNIVIIHVKNELLDDPEDKGRQELYNIGTGKGYFITNGTYEPITWKKNSRSERTIYYDLKGNEIKFNDGITWVHIVPTNAAITIE